LARLIVLSGLPGSGKSTLAKGLSDLSGAILLRVDVFEQDLRNVNSSDFDVGAQGYQIGYDHARRHLLEGKDVIADAVNAVEPAREGWRAIAQETGTRVIEIEIVCTNEGCALVRRASTACCLPVFKNAASVSGSRTPRFQEQSIRLADRLQTVWMIFSTS
jgi:predicted kinase